MSDIGEMEAALTEMRVTLQIIAAGVRPDPKRSGRTQMKRHEMMDAAFEAADIYEKRPTWHETLRLYVMRAREYFDTVADSGVLDPDSVKTEAERIPYIDEDSIDGLFVTMARTISILSQQNESLREDARAERERAYELQKELLELRQRVTPMEAS